MSNATTSKLEAKVDCGKNQAPVFASIPMSSKDEFLGFVERMADSHDLAVIVTLTSERRGVVFHSARLPKGSWRAVAA